MAYCVYRDRDGLAHSGGFSDRGKAVELAATYSERDSENTFSVWVWCDRRKNYFPEKGES